MSLHTGRVSAIIGREAAVFIARESGSESLITVTRTLTSPPGDHATVLVSVLPGNQTERALAFLARQREAFSDHLKKRTRLSPLPRVDFQLDNGEKNRQRLDELSGEL